MKGSKATRSKDRVGVPRVPKIEFARPSREGHLVTEPKNPKATPVGHENVDTDPVPSGPRPRFVSSQPPAVLDERTIVGLVRAFAYCDHPKRGRSPAVVIDSDGSRKEFYWCGACGGVRLPNDGDPRNDWLRPRVAQLLRDDGRLAGVARGVGARLEKLSELVKTAHAMYAHSSAPVDSRRELLAHLLDLEAAFGEFARFVRGEFGDPMP